MTVDHEIEQLIKSLFMLGYNSIQVRNIVHAALGRREIAGANHDERLLLIDTLEQYVKLGEEYMLCYSK